MTSIGSRLKQLRINKGFTQPELAEKIGISSGQISKREADKSTNLTASTISAYMNIFSVSADYIMTGIDSKSSLSTEELSLINSYRKLTPLDRSRISGYIEIASQDYANSNVTLQDSASVYEYKQAEGFIPVVGNVAAGLPIDAIENILTYINTDIPNVQFALYAKGISMEPVIHDEEIILVHKTPEIENGEIGIFQIGDEATCKIYHQYEDRIELCSFNPNFTPLVYLKKDLISFQIAGKVILTPTQKARLGRQ